MGFVNTPEKPRDEDLPGDLGSYRFDSVAFFEHHEQTDATQTIEEKDPGVKLARALGELELGMEISRL